MYNSPLGGGHGERGKKGCMNIKETKSKDSTEGTSILNINAITDVNFAFVRVPKWLAHWVLVSKT